MIPHRRRECCAHLQRSTTGREIPSENRALDEAFGRERRRSDHGQVACQVAAEPVAVVSAELLFSQSAPFVLLVETELAASNVKERVGLLTLIESTNTTVGLDHADEGRALSSMPMLLMLVLT